MQNTNERTLQPALAKQLIQLISISEHWMLAPQYDGPFSSDAQAYDYVNANPGKPLMLIVPLASGDYSESLLVSASEQGELYLDDDSMGGLSGTAKSLDELCEVAFALISKVQTAPVQNF